MTLDKAIEIKEQHQKGTDPIYLPDLPEADRLSIEALKCIKTCRIYGGYNSTRPLPGETEN